MLTNQHLKIILLSSEVLMIERFETFVIAITEIYKAIQKIKVQQMAELGLKGTHVMCLFFLKEHPYGLTSAELSQLCHEDKAAISRILKELNQKDLIFSEDKKYRSKINLTEKGIMVTNTMYEKIIKAVNLAAIGYSKEERDIFYRVLLQVAENLKTESVEK